MALETLKGINEIGGFKTGSTGDVTLGYNIDDHIWTKSFRGKDPEHIFVDHQRNAITFKIQNGPIKENGVNGAQIDVLAHTLKLIVEGLNKNFPSEFNDRAIKGLDDCLQAFADRKADREKRNVEGMSLE